MLCRKSAARGGKTLLSKPTNRIAYMHVRKGVASGGNNTRLLHFPTLELTVVCKFAAPGFATIFARCHHFRSFLITVCHYWRLPHAKSFHLQVPADLARPACDLRYPDQHWATNRAADSCCWLKPLEVSSLAKPPHQSMLLREVITR